MKVKHLGESMRHCVNTVVVLALLGGSDGLLADSQPNAVASTVKAAQPTRDEAMKLLRTSAVVASLSSGSERDYKDFHCQPVALGALNGDKFDAKISCKRDAVDAFLTITLRGWVSNLQVMVEHADWKVIDGD